MQINHDFGFNSQEFLGELSSIPYAQFFNPSDKKFGIAITAYRRDTDTVGESNQLVLK